MSVSSFDAFRMAGLLLAGLSAAASAAPPLVAVIDSGVAQTAELRPLLAAEYDFGSAVQRPAFRPRYDHGTMVATILARAAEGDVRIVSMRIDDPAGCPAGATPPCQPDAAPIAAAIRQATRLGVDIINLSLALKDDRLIADAVGEAARAGIVVVMAAGNQGRAQPDNLAMARAGYPNTILVGALDAAGKPWAGSNRPAADRIAGYHYVWQRGVDVPTALANGTAATGTGTSFATPIEAARLSAAHRRLIVAQVAPRVSTDDGSGSSGGGWPLLP